MRTRITLRYREAVEYLYVHEMHISPALTVHVAVDRRGAVHRVAFRDFSPELPRGMWERNKYPCGEAEMQLHEYFRGARDHFTVEVATPGTSFQQEVWRALRKVSYGSTVSYGELARRIGRRNAARAVGGAVSRNPVAIIIPCHRVISASGTAGEYARRNLPGEEGRRIKGHLLALERRDLLFGGIHL